jgi:hypothetical protein
MRAWALSALHREIEISSPLVGPRDVCLRIPPCPPRFLYTHWSIVPGQVYKCASEHWTDTANFLISSGACSVLYWSGSNKNEHLWCRFCELPHARHTFHAHFRVHLVYVVENVRLVFFCNARSLFYICNAAWASHLQFLLFYFSGRLVFLAGGWPLEWEPLFRFLVSPRWEQKMPDMGQSTLVI